MADEHDLAAWMRLGKYLPRDIRDFHDQKDLFKAVHELVDRSDSEYTRDLNFIQAQVYTIDFFLWYMARRGYVLRRAREKLPFRDLKEDMAAAKKERDAAAAAVLRARFATKGDAEGGL